MSEQHNNDPAAPPQKERLAAGDLMAAPVNSAAPPAPNPPVVGRNVAEAAPLNATGKGMSVTVAACHSAASPPAPHHSVAVPQTPPGW